MDELIGRTVFIDGNTMRKGAIIGAIEQVDVGPAVGPQQYYETGETYYAIQEIFEDGTRDHAVILRRYHELQFWMS